MLLLLTIALVLIGAVALVIGFVGGSQLPIFISIACSVLAGLVLVIFSRMSRRQPAAVPAGGPAPIGEAVSERPATALVDDTAVHDAVMDEEEEEEPVPARAAASDGGGWSSDDFPIEEYDELLVSEILPLLPELDADELELVREREQQGKARATLLRRIDQLGEEAGAGAVAVTTAERPRSTFERPARDEEPEEEEEEDDLEPVGAVGDDDVLFPIEDYDDLRVSEILPLLPELYDDELDMVADREREGANRATILNRIDELLSEGEAPPPPKKLTPKRAAPKKTAAKKKAAPAKRTPAKKAAAAKKTTAKKATAAKKTTAKKATAKKATAKKAATRRR